MADDWGETTETKPSTTALSDPWGSAAPAAADDGWGSSTTSSSAGGAWGSTSKPATDGWGSSSNNSKPNNNRNSGFTSSYGPKGGNSGWGASTTSNNSKPEGGGGKSRVNIPSMLILEKLPCDTTSADLKAHFGRFGKITRIVTDTRYEENRCQAWMDFENAVSADVSANHSPLSF